MSSMHATPRPSLRAQARPFAAGLCAALLLALAVPLAAAQATKPMPQAQSTDGGPGTGDPGQGRDLVKLGTRDLALGDTFAIGPKAMGWGTSTTLASTDASFRRGGACGFRFGYRTHNLGTAPTPGTSNRITRDTQAGPVLATHPVSALQPGMQTASSGHVMLKPGTWLLYVRVDAPGLVTETNEANNLRRVQVTVAGSCAG